jgi:hypothetical protein
MSDLFEAIKARDEGLTIVGTNAGEDFWRDAFSVLKEFRGEKIIIEQVKLRMQMRGFKLPPHHNAWGSFTMEAVRAGKLIKQRGQLRQCTAKRSHGRWSQVYYVR